MGAQRLSERKTRRIAARTGLPVIRAWGHGGYVHDFVTAGHLHGWYDIKSGDWGVEAEPRSHYNTCPPASPTAGDDALFPAGVPPLTAAEFEAVYAARSGVTVEQLHGWGRYAERCDCGDESCEGWAMGHQWEDAIIEDQFRSHSAGGRGTRPAPDRAVP